MALCQRLQHKYEIKGKYGVTACKTDYINTSHCDVKAATQATYDSIPFDMYIIRSGEFRNAGDGGFINWCFSGYKARNGMTVTF